MNIKNLAHCFTKRQRGAILIPALIMLALGAIIIGPLLGFMATGLNAGRHVDINNEDYYAADAGIETGIRYINSWVIDEAFNPATPPIIPSFEIRGKTVSVIVYAHPNENLPDTYVINSKAHVGETLVAEITAHVEYMEGGAVAEGGLGGDFRTNSNMKGLALLSPDIFVFTTATPNTRFQGREDTDYGETFGTEDIWLLNMADGTSASFFDASQFFVNNQTNYAISGIHYYNDGGQDYLLISVEDNGTINNTTYSKSDIIQMAVTIDWVTDPAHPVVTTVHNRTLLHTISGADIISLSRKSDGTIIFSVHTDSLIGVTTYTKGQVIEYDPINGISTLLFDAIAILGNPPGGLEVDSLAYLPTTNGHVLVSFKVNSITGSDGRRIVSEDIAIWRPDTNTINLHIGMDGQGGMIAVPSHALIVRTWDTK